MHVFVNKKNIESQKSQGEPNLCFQLDFTCQLAYHKILYTYSDLFQPQSVRLPQHGPAMRSTMAQNFNQAGQQIRGPVMRPTMGPNSNQYQPIHGGLGMRPGMGPNFNRGQPGMQGPGMVPGMQGPGMQGPGMRQTMAQRMAGGKFSMPKFGGLNNTISSMKGQMESRLPSMS